MNCKKTMIDKSCENLSITEQCDIMGMNRTSYYYKNLPLYNPYELLILNRMDEIFTEYPFYGYRRIHNLLKNENILLGKDRVLKYMHVLGLETFYPKKRTTFSNKMDKKYPYLLKNLEIFHPNQVWAIDITYIRLKSGFCYAVVIIDWFSRYILSYKLSNSLDTDFCIDALNEAIRKYGKPEIFNSDQGCQFTSEIFTSVLESCNIRISMDSVGRAYDNIIIERFFRTLKYEDIYLKNYDSMKSLKGGICKYLFFYNNERYHSAFNYQTPNKIYYSKKEELTG